MEVVLSWPVISSVLCFMTEFFSPDKVDALLHGLPYELCDTGMFPLSQGAHFLDHFGWKTHASHIRFHDVYLDCMFHVPVAHLCNKSPTSGNSNFLGEGSN